MMSVLTSLLAWAVGSIRRSPRAWLAGVVITAIAISIGLIYHAGAVNERRRADRERHAAELARVHEQIAIADHVQDSTSREEAAAAAAETKAKAAQGPIRARAAIARSRVAIVSDSSVSVDRQPAIVVSAPVVDVIRHADSALVADSVTQATSDARERALVADRAAIAEQRDLERTRADTAEHQDTTPRATSRCGLTCKTVAVIGSAAVVVKVVVPFIARRIHPRAKGQT